MSAPARFGAVIVNYNSARLALDAALSVLGDGGARAVIVDNCSADDSRAYLADALSGARTHECEPPALSGDSDPSIRAPRFAALEGAAIDLIAAPDNGGFARGCNIGLRRLAADDSYTHFLLLNPDALLAAGALGAFARRLSDPRAGLCGATIAEFAPPHRVQAFGGAAAGGVLPTGRNIGEGARLDAAPRREAVEGLLAYPLGAALAFRRDYLDAAGFLDERYFLYFEELDWTRAGAPRFSPAWAPDALVFHRYGAASKSVRKAGAPSQRSPLADYRMARSRRLFLEKWRPAAAPLALAAACAQAATRIARGRARNALAVLRGALPGSPRAF